MCNLPPPPTPPKNPQQVMPMLDEITVFLLWINPYENSISLAFLGANVEIKDHLGRNFLHLTVLHSGGLQHLNAKFLQVQDASVCVR